MLEKKLFIELSNYINKYRDVLILEKCEILKCEESNSCYNFLNPELEDFIKNKRKPTFSQVLFSFIDKKGVSDSTVYKKAGIDRRLFSKIRSNPNYKPGKNTAIALVLALELNKKDSEELLSVAGYSLSESDTFDLIIQFCIERKIYDIDDVNEALNYFSLKPLVGVIE